MGLAVPLGAAPVAVAVRADEGTAVLRASTALFTSRPVATLLVLVPVFSAIREFTMVFAAAELLVRVMVVVQDVLEAAGEDTLFSPGTHWE